MKPEENDVSIPDYNLTSVTRCLAFTSHSSSDTLVACARPVTVDVVLARHASCGRHEMCRKHGGSGVERENSQQPGRAKDPDSARPRPRCFMDHHPLRATWVRAQRHDRWSRCRKVETPRCTVEARPFFRCRPIGNVLPHCTVVWR